MDQQSLPHFTNETEEAQWWYEQRDQLTANAEKAAEQGELRLRHLSASNKSTRSLKSITFYISEQDLLRARDIS